MQVQETDYAAQIEDASFDVSDAFESLTKAVADVCARRNSESQNSALDVPAALNVALDVASSDEIKKLKRIARELHEALVTRWKLSL